MELTSLGHAGFRVSGAHTVGLVDPWFDPAGAYLGSWHQLPDNGHLLTPALLAPDWIAISGDGDDRCDLATLSRVRPGTPVFVAAGNRPLTTRLGTTRLRVVEVTPSVPMMLDDSGSRLTFVPGWRSDPTTSSLVMNVDRVSLLVCAPSPPEHAHLRDIRSAVDNRFDIVAVPVARPDRDPLCEDLSASALGRRSSHLRATSLDHACDVAVAADARVVVPFGGPPCFLDPELAHLNRAITPPGVLPDIEQVAGLLRPRLPGRRVTTMLPGDRFFPSHELVVDDLRWRGFSFLRLEEYLHDYAHARAVHLSRVHSRFAPPDNSFGPAFKARLESLVGAGSDIADHVRFEVTGPGGGNWDVIVDDRGAHVDLSGRASAATARLRIASHWLAAVVDGRVTWRQLLRSLRYSLAHTAGRHRDPLLDFLEQIEVVTAYSW